jgi:hypothetical protein
MSQPPEQPGPWDGQPPPYGHLGYGYPPRRRRLLPWILTGGGVLILAVVVILVVVLTSGPDTSSPKGIGEAAAEAFTDSDFDDLVELSCPGSEDAVQQTIEGFDRTTTNGDRLRVTAEVHGLSMDGNDEAHVILQFTATRVPDELLDEFGDDVTGKSKMSVAKENGEWCIVGFGG